MFQFQSDSSLGSDKMVSELIDPWQQKRLQRGNQILGVKRFGSDWVGEREFSVKSLVAPTTTDRPYAFFGYGGGLDRRNSRSLPRSQPAADGIGLGEGSGPQILVKSLIPDRSVKTTKSMVRYEAVASDPTAVWRIVSATNHKADVGQHQLGNFQKRIKGLQESMNRIEVLIQRLESSQTRDIPDRVPPAELKNEKTRRTEDQWQIRPNSTQEIQPRGASEGNLNSPLTGSSVVVTGWEQDPKDFDEDCGKHEVQLEEVIDGLDGAVSGNFGIPSWLFRTPDYMAPEQWNHQKPSQEPALVRHWPLNPKEYLDQSQFKYQAKQWNSNPSSDRAPSFLKPLAKGPILDSLEEQMEQTTVKATTCTVEGHNADWKPHQILEMTDDEADFHMRQGAFLYNFDAQMLHKGYHCFFRRLMLEYSKFSSLDSYEPFACKLNNPKHRDTYKQVNVHVLNYEAILWEKLPKFSMQQLYFVGLLWNLPPWPDLSFCEVHWRAMGMEKGAGAVSRRYAYNMVARQGKNQFQPTRDKQLIDFVKEWVARVEQYKLKDNEWFSALYSCRKQWAPGNVDHSFWASERGLGIYDDFYVCGHEYLEDIIYIGAREHELEEFLLSVMKEVKDIGFTGAFRLIFRPLVDELTCFGAVCFSLRQKKQLDFRLWVIGGEISVIPGNSDTLEDTIKNAIEDSITWSVRIVIPIIHGDYSGLELKSVGIVEVNLGQARDLTNKDVIGKSDPFAILYVPPLPDQTKRSQTINKYADTHSVTVKIYDGDGIQGSELIGCVQVVLNDLQKGKVKDVWLKLVQDLEVQRDRKNWGQEHLELLYCPSDMKDEAYTVERDVCPVAEGAVQGHALSVVTSKQLEVDGLKGLDVVEVKVGECEIKADQNCNIIVDHKRLSETTHQASCAPIDINSPESTGDPRNSDDVNQMDMHGNGAMASSTEQAVTVHLEISSSLHFVEVIPSSQAFEGTCTENSRVEGSLHHTPENALGGIYGVLNQKGSSLILNVSKMIPAFDKGRLLASGRVFSGKVAIGMKVYSLTLERVAYGFSAGDWVWFKEEDQKHSQVRILHSIDRNGTVYAGLKRLNTFGKGGYSDLQVVEAYCVGQFERLEFNISSTHFEWQRKSGGGFSTDRISHILPNGCLVVKLTVKSSFGKVCNCLAEPYEVEVVSYGKYEGIMKKYGHLENFYGAVRLLLITMGFLTAMRLGILVGSNITRPRSRIATSVSDQGGDHHQFLQQEVQKQCQYSVAPSTSGKHTSPENFLKYLDCAMPQINHNHADLGLKLNLKLLSCRNFCSNFSTLIWGPRSTHLRTSVLLRRRQCQNLENAEERLPVYLERIPLRSSSLLHLTVKIAHHREERHQTVYISLITVCLLSA